MRRKSAADFGCLDSTTLLRRVSLSLASNGGCFLRTASTKAWREAAMFRSSLALCAFALFAVIACDRGQPVAPGERPQYSQTKEAKPSSAAASASENAKTGDAPPQVSMEEPDSRSPVSAAAALQPALAMKGK